MKLVIASTWDGQPVGADSQAEIELKWSADTLSLTFVAPFRGDPPPPGPPGPRWELWNHEVLELFVLGDEEHYTEIELGPHGHHLVLRLEGRRHVVERELPVDYASQIEGERWSGEAKLSRDFLPEGPLRVNAYAIRGVGDERVYFAAYPVPGAQPDFHRLEHFGPSFKPI